MQNDAPTILIIDDQPSTLQALAKTLHGHYTLLVASNGTEALEIARARLPDLILLDVMLPDISGLDVCRTIKADPELRDIPVIFVTARDEAEDEAAGLDIGAIDYICKPFNPPIVQARVRNHLELKRQRDLLQRIAMIDGLTGVANRRSFDQMFRQEWRRAIRTQEPLSLLLIDVDHFKAYNDTYGHQEGDDCLRAIAESLSAQAHRAEDLLARYGGEEFVCLLPATPLAQAHHRADAMRQAVIERNIPHKGSTTATTVSISIGVSCLVPSLAFQADDLLRHADAMLYQAKHSGRNRVEAAACPLLDTRQEQG